MALSPMMRQYLEVKKDHEDAIVFFRLGDFYEMFFDDAKIASKELELTLTGRQCGEEDRAPMCGVPYHAAETYIGRLVERGYKVVICEQTEDPAQAKGIVTRDVVRIVTPGTQTDSKQLPEGKNNYLASVAFFEDVAALALCDVSTGDIRLTRLSDGETALINELSVYTPKEILVNRQLQEGSEVEGYIRKTLSCVVSVPSAEVYEKKAIYRNIKGALSLEPDAVTSDEAIIMALSGLCHYLIETQKTDLSYLKAPVIYESGDFMEIDHNSRRNLELTEAMRTREKKGTLLWVLDKTKTALGARLLRKWIEFPLKNANTIVRRQSAVAEFVKEYMLREDVGEALRPVLDLERIMTRVVYGSAGGKELRAFAATVQVLPRLKSLLTAAGSAELATLAAAIDTLEDLFTAVDKTIVEDPPFSVREGGFIAEGVNPELDELRALMKDSKAVLEGIERREKEATGIKNMKIGYNRVFGYYIEVSKSNIPDVPPSYIRKQTLTNGERYITPELKELEAKILSASERSCAIEYEIFKRICELLSKNIRRIQKAAEVIATVDVYRSLAEVAVKNSYVQPEVDISDVIDIKEGRHPVVEEFARESGFVPNDAYLDTRHNRLILLTGPNMAGKSTYMRQIALICVMAQIGSFVPARDARIGIVDKLFTRVGASDDLASGQSTFMLEMSEVSYILKNATPKSLIIYDEIGRGTATFDGMSIAKAVAEYTAGKKIGARTLFATHYHELCELEGTVEGVVNYSIIAKKKDRGIVFLRKIVKGAADDSYGIEVAQLAGLPQSVIKRAKEVLATLEKGNRPIPQTPSAAVTEEHNMSFDDYIHEEILHKLKMTDMESLTPLEALILLSELKKMIP
ncbi:MAG: DNA mismatch repair protein MutS [Clostridia bacterium]|nr:DNA mismatch repair protein MutS [Clostridia bacterium]